eukprot:7627932-Pyramimonas_sp.AAC.1
MSAAAPNDKSWAGPNSEQWVFDANLSHLRCVKLVKEVDFAMRSPTFETNTTPFLHFFGANAFHGKRGIRLFCKSCVANIRRPTLLANLSEAVKLAAEYNETSTTTRAMEERKRMRNI